ncbi:MAG: hypothetical protein M3Q99_20355 [Acidobacteriota bacterium]|nr:hypothetical protein [Acidobacteriota bacterium]
MKTEKSFPARNGLTTALILIIIFLAYRKTAATEEILKALKSSDEAAKTRRIRCPFCKWQPTKSSRWFCADCDAPEYFYGGCLTSWNTFSTGGVCPGCAHQWRWTSCLRCEEWARHEDWYEKD